MSERTIQILDDLTALATAAAERVVAAANVAINARGVFSIALSGGNTPRSLFEVLASDSYSPGIDWPNWEIYFGDERCVPPEHAESNFRTAFEALLNRVPIKPEHIHRMKGEIDPQESAIEYGKLLKEKFGDGGMDLILLGMGDDGHTASLFPRTAALKETHHRCVANFVPRLNVWRVTLSAPFINRARQIMILISGESKAKRLAEVLEGPRDPDRLPIQMIESVNGEVTWLIDATAAASLEKAV